MARIVATHSFRGGTGKSNTTANVAALIAATGKKVGIVDTDIQSPGIHVLFGLGEDRVRRSLNDYLWGRCGIDQAAYDVTPADVLAGDGRIWLTPSSLHPGEIARILREGYNVNRLSDGFRDLSRHLDLDYLFIDTHPGLNEETLLSMALSDVLLLVLRPDQQDFQGTAVTVDVARKLDVARLLLVVNKAHPATDLPKLKREIETAYSAPVAAVFPLTDEMVRLGSRGLFAFRHPAHPLTGLLKQLATTVTGG
jgi:septum site-determining protein MinD